MLTFSPRLPLASQRLIGAQPLAVAAGVTVVNAILVVVLVRGLGMVAVAAAVAVPLLYLVWRRPQLGVLALAALVPYDGLLEVLPLPSVAKDWKEGLVLFTLAATLFADRGARRPGRAPGWAPAVVALILVGLASAVLLGGPDAITGFRIDFFYVLLAIAIWRCPLDRKHRDRLVTIFMVNGALTAAYGVAQQALGAARLNALGYQYNTTIRYTHGFLRSFSTFSYQSPFGYFLMAVLLLGLSSALDDPQRSRNRWFLASTPLLAAGLFFTFERGAWLGLAGGLLYLAIRRYRVMLLAVPLLAVAVALLPANARGGSFNSTSLGQRTGNWQSHVSDVLLTPLGHGIGSSGAAAAKGAVQASGATTAATAFAAGSSTYNADDQYIATAYDLGLFGLWFLVLMMLAAARCCHQRAGPARHGEDTFAVAVTAIIIGYFLGSLVAVVFEMFPMDVIWWLLIATVAASERSDPVGQATPAGLEPVGASR